ncbi:MAG: hypothetical protein ACOYOK_01395 [Pseudobdellovibrionaceae bacterium]
MLKVIFLLLIPVISFAKSQSDTNIENIFYGDVSLVNLTNEQKIILLDKIKKNEFSNDNFENIDILEIEKVLISSINRTF